jgi:hypothetical protein
VAGGITPGIRFAASAEACHVNGTTPPADAGEPIE